MGHKVFSIRSSQKFPYKVQRSLVKFIRRRSTAVGGFFEQLNEKVELKNSAKFCQPLHFGHGAMQIVAHNSYSSCLPLLRQLPRDDQLRSCLTRDELRRLIGRSDEMRSERLFIKQMPDKGAMHT